MPERRITFDSILRAKRRLIANLEQMIRDVNYWNSLPQAFGKPFDIEAERVALHHARRSEQFWLNRQTRESSDEWQLVLNALQTSAFPNV